MPCQITFPGRLNRIFTLSCTEIEMTYFNEVHVSTYNASYYRNYISCQITFPRLLKKILTFYLTKI